MGGYALTKTEEIILSNCDGCHGTDGVAKVESWPNLACQNRGYLYLRLIYLRRNNDHDIDSRVKTLSLTNIEEISRHYSELICTRP